MSFPEDIISFNKQAKTTQPREICHDLKDKNRTSEVTNEDPLWQSLISMTLIALLIKQKSDNK